MTAPFLPIPNESDPDLVDCYVSRVRFTEPSWVGFHWLYRRGGVASGPLIEDVGLGVLFDHDDPGRLTDWCMGSFHDGVWAITLESRLTVSPSLHCLACGRHGFIVEGRWRDCG